MTPAAEGRGGSMYAYGEDLIAEKRAAPCPDMLSTVIHAELPDADPPQLRDDELSAFFSLVFSAGAETTRNAIAGSMLAFLAWPEQLDSPIRAGPDGLRGRRDPALDDAVAVQTQDGDHRVRVGRRTHQARAEGRRLGGFGQPGSERFDEPDSSCCGVTPIRICPSAMACTSAWEPTWPASRSASRSKRSSARSSRSRSPAPVLDPQQPPHGYPPPAVLRLRPPVTRAGRRPCAGPGRRRAAGQPGTSGRCRSKTASSSSRGAASSRVSAPKIMVARSAGSHATPGADAVVAGGRPSRRRRSHACCICVESVSTAGPTAREDLHDRQVRPPRTRTAAPAHGRTPRIPPKAGDSQSKR